MLTSMMFEWCSECSLKMNCYPTEGRGPLLLEPACGEGPAKEEEDNIDGPLNGLDNYGSLE